MPICAHHLMTFLVENPVRIPGRISEQVPGRISERNPIGIWKRVPGRNSSLDSEETTRRISEEILEEIPENVPGGIFDETLITTYLKKH